jgi:uncharacterized protein YecE (DUF72 family)
MHIAARELKGALPSYASKFGLLEIHPTVQPGAAGTAARTNPTLKTLRAWRKEVGPAFEFCIVAPAALRSPRPAEALDREIEATLAMVDAAQARTLLVQTAPDVTPSSVWRERLVKLFERLGRDGTLVVWEPSGLWEAEEAAVFAKKHGAVLCVDPFQAGVPRGPVAYLRLRALGETRSFGGARLEALAAELRERREVYVVVEAPRALTTAMSLDALVREPPRTQGGALVPRRAAASAADEEE